MPSPTQHPHGDLECQGQMAAEVGQFAQCLGFEPRSFVAFVGVVQGARHQVDGVVRGKRFEVDEAYREGVGAVPGGDEYPMVVGVGQQRHVLRRIRRVVQDQQHPVPTIGEERTVCVVLACSRRRQIPVPYTERVQQSQYRLISRDRVVVVPT